MLVADRATKTMKIGRMLKVISLGLSSVSLGACHSSPPSGQVLATVDGKEITLAQFEEALGSAAEGDPREPATRAKVAQGLIDQALFNDAAIKEGVDRDPQVVLAMEQAKAAVLAQAYLKRITPTRPLNLDEMQDWYSRHPELYAKRRHYLVTDVLVKSGGGNDLQSFVAPLQKTLPLDKLIAVLRQRGADLEVKNYQFSSDGVETALAKAFAPLAEGEGYSFEEGGKRHFGRVEQAVVDPVSFEDSLYAIRERMLIDRVKDAADARLAALRRTNAVVLGDLGKNVLARQSFTEDPKNARDAKGGTLSSEARKKAIKQGLNGL